MIYDSIHDTLSKKGINTITGDMYDFISRWTSWYRGNVNDFHYYHIRLADGTTQKKERLTMNMSKKICEDFAKLMWSEKVKITLDSNKKTIKLLEILENKKNNFRVNFPTLVEKTFAMGTGATIEYLKDNEVMIDYLEADVIIPYLYCNNNITGIITLDSFTEGTGKDKVYYFHLTYHEYVDGVYRTYHELYKSKKSHELGKQVNFEEMFPDVKNIEIVTQTPHFQILRPNIVNNLDLNNPMGISVFANHIDKLKALDIAYDSFNEEILTGKRRILVDKTALKGTPTYDPATDTTTQTLAFDKNDTVYQAISGMENAPVKEINFNIRHNEFIESIKTQLNLLSAGVGLGQAYYSFDRQTGIKTATEVISEKSDTFRTKKNHEIILYDMLYNLISAVMELSGIKSKEINIEFDDSIIEDKATEIKQGLELLQNKVISKHTFLVDYLGYGEEEAKLELEKIASDTVTPENIDFFGVNNE